MKLRKRMLTEELGLSRDKKKSYTTNKKQKVMLSETQLQRLLSRLSEHEKDAPHSHIEDSPTWGGKPCHKCCKGPDGVYGLTPQPGMSCKCPKSHLEVPCKPTTSPITRYRIDAGGCLACPSGSPASACPYTSMPQCNTALANYGNNNNNVTAQCCQDPQGNQVAGSCPNNCVAPNQCTNCSSLSESNKNKNNNMRTLRTTNPITEGEIKNIKSMMSRMTTAGKEYNPTTLTKDIEGAQKSKIVINKIKKL